VITGFNTDVEHGGVVYHVQTEDKGLDSPIILSLVYSGGAILASKRAPYEDLLASGFSEAALAERLKRQHRLICAAIHAGRIDDLKRMGGAPAGLTSTVADEETTLETVGLQSESAQIEEPSELEQPQEAPTVTDSVDGSTTDSSTHPYSIHDSRRQSPLGELPTADHGLIVSLLDEVEFRSGDSVNVRVMVTQRSGEFEKPLNNVSISLKVLGTTFRPQIYSTKTQRNGLATIATQIPLFTSGRAAILVRAVSGSQSTEIRRVVHPGR
jgi:hypothetical protein